MKRRMRRRRVPVSVSRKPLPYSGPCVIELFWPEIPEMIHEPEGAAMCEKIDLSTKYGRLRFQAAHDAYSL